MRLTNEEILTQFPFWSNHPSGNIQQVRYGDIPDCQYTQESYNHYQLETDPYLLNILLANACIYSQHGAFDIYKTIAGDVYIHTETQQILYGSIDIPYRGKTNYMSSKSYVWTKSTITTLLAWNRKSKRIV